MRKGNGMTDKGHERVAIVAGVGPGLGAALAHKLVGEGCRVAKFAVRGLAQSLAVELGPKGVHVAHVVIDGVIDTRKVRRTYKPSAKEPLLKPEAIADSYWDLIQQERSAWSLEIDLRPNKETFFE